MKGAIDYPMKSQPMRFDPFRLIASERRLVRDGRPVPIGGRAFDVLLALIEHRERVLTKDELLAIVWGDVIVEENSLQVQISALRRALGRDAIATIPGKGYQFVLRMEVCDNELGGTPGASASAGGEGRAVLTQRKDAFELGMPPLLGHTFVGGDTVVQEVLDLLAHGHRHISLTGPGGVGKTRLAIEVASRFNAKHQKSIVWVNLTHLREACEVLPALAAALGAGTNLAETFRSRDVLMVLDNFEHVIEAACLLPRFLDRCPNLTVITTSRELLRVSGELEVTIPPLLDQHAVALFCSLAHVDPSDEIRDLCRRLDNLPHAIEIAAERTKVATAGQLLDRLIGRLDMFTGKRDVDPRHRSLRATLDWSYDMLPQAERQLFERLAVFEGSWSLEAAEEVTGATLGTMQSLLEKSLIRREGGRFAMLQTTWQYAAERLAQSCGALELRERHTLYFVSYAREFSLSKTGAPSLRDVRADVANFRSALAWLQGQGSTTVRLELVMALFSLWMGGGFHSEGRVLLEACLRDGASVSERLRARAHRILGDIAIDQGRYDAAQQYLESALATFESLGDDCALCIVELGMVADYRGDAGEAIALFKRAIEVSTSAGNQRALAWALHNYGALLIFRGDVANGEAACQESLKLDEAKGDAGPAYLLCVALLSKGEIAPACAQFRHSLEAFAGGGYFPGVARALGGLAAVLSHAGRHEHAARAWGTAKALIKRSGVSQSPAERQFESRILDVTRKALGDGGFGQLLLEGKGLDATTAANQACVLLSTSE